ncbi:unnamed protein product, partial [Amoebophrya sp. A120]
RPGGPAVVVAGSPGAGLSGVSLIPLPAMHGAAPALLCFGPAFLPGTRRPAAWSLGPVSTRAAPAPKMGRVIVAWLGGLKDGRNLVAPGLAPRPLALSYLAQRELGGPRSSYVRSLARRAPTAALRGVGSPPALVGGFYWRASLPVVVGLASV